MTNTPEAVTPTEAPAEEARKLLERRLNMQYVEHLQLADKLQPAIAKAITEAEARGEARGREAERKMREQILRNAHLLLRRKYRKTPLWGFIEDVCAVGSTNAVAICRELGWNPHEDGSKDLPPWSFARTTEETSQERVND